MSLASRLAVKAAKRKVARAAAKTAAPEPKPKAEKPRVAKPEGKKPTTKPKAAPLPSPQKIIFPDEGEWELPADFDEPVEIVSSPAQPKPPRKKIKAYHGTPHRFKPEVKVRNIDDGFEFYHPRLSDPRNLSPGLEVVKDYPLGRFRLENMGSGAGAQMYGAGVYTAEAPAVARQYRGELISGNAPSPTIGGVDASRMYIDLLNRADKLPVEQGQLLYDRASLIEDLLHTGDTLDVDEAIARGYGGYSPELVDWYKKSVEGKWDAPGALYELNLDVDPDQMLAWNTPVAEQPLVRGALAPLMQKYEIPEEELYGKYPLTGADLYHGLSFRSDVLPAEMAKMLTGAGLSGIRYVDTGSGPGGTSTQNYVMMDPDLIEILKRYREGGAVNKVEDR